MTRPAQLLYEITSAELVKMIDIAVRNNDTQNYPILAEIIRNMNGNAVQVFGVIEQRYSCL